jgi:hypothetical protein
MPGKPAADNYHLSNTSGGPAGNCGREPLMDTEKEWAERSLFLIREFLPLMSPLAAHPHWTAEERLTLASVATACARTSESVLLLCAYGQLWDAEVLARSVFEGSLKLAYLLQDRKTFKERHEQYAEDLFQIGRLRDHQKAADLLGAVPDPQKAQWKPIRDMLLPNDEHASISTRFNAGRRRELDMIWGAAGLMRSLTHSGDKQFTGFTGLAHGYAIASHIQHADFIGTSLPMDRDTRSADRRDSIHLAHLARLISDTFAFFLMRLIASYRYVGHDSAPIRSAIEKIRSLEEDFGTPYRNWVQAEYGTAISDEQNQT